MELFMKNFTEINQSFDYAININKWYINENSFSLRSAIENISNLTIEYIEKISELFQAKEYEKEVVKAISYINEIEKYPEFKNRKVEIFISDLPVKSILDADISNEELRKLSKNIAQSIYYDKDDIIQKFYNRLGKNNEYSIRISLNFLKILLQRYRENYQKDIEKTKSILRDVSLMLKNSKNKKIHIIDRFRNFCILLKEKISNSSFSFMLRNYSSFCGLTSFVKQIVEEKRDMSVDETTERKKDYKKGMKYLGEINICGNEFSFYISDSNKKGVFTTNKKEIVVNPYFWKLSRGIQTAILLHESGHHLQGHFDKVGIKDEEKLRKNIQKEYKRADKLFRKNGLLIPKNNKDEVIIDLLVELDADRYASKYIGKHLVRESLKKKNLKYIIKNKDIPNIQKKVLLRMLKVRMKMI